MWLVHVLVAAECNAESPLRDTKPENRSTAPESARQFLKQNCYDCHVGKGAEAGLDLEQLSDELTDSNTPRWVRIFDRVHDQEMPPKDYGELSPKDRKSFLNSTAGWIEKTQLESYATKGRVKAKRLTNLQLERSLHDLLGIDIPLAARMPEEPRTAGFNTVADGQAMSHFQLQQHLDVIDTALEEAFRRALNGPKGDTLERNMTARQVARQNQKRRCREPEMLGGNAVVWSGNLVFYGRMPATTAPKDGWYRFKINAKGLKLPGNKKIWCTVRSGECYSGSPLMSWVGAFEVGKEFKEVTFDAWLPKDHRIEVRPGDLTLKRARFKGGQVGAGEGGRQDVPGLAMKSVHMKQIHKGPSDDEIRKLLFGSLQLNYDTKSKQQIVSSKEPRKDLAALIRKFAQWSFRRRVANEKLAPYIQIAIRAYDKDQDIVAALRTGYRAVLCSPRFLYLQEKAGPLDDFAIASRLSYLIWNRMPDKQLLRLASDKKLANPEMIWQQTKRMLADPKGQNFVVDLADQWLDLNLIDFTEPDRRLYPGFDVIVQNSMLEETHAFLRTMLEKDLSVSHLIDSDFTYLNSRLASYYDLHDFKDIEGDGLQKVSLKSSDRYGGLLTHGSIMKVTANGTTTSPIIRGVWVSERLLGQEIPPPPENIPAIEPDVRGAKTIREMLAKHKENGDCAACHKKIDPPGFALENFDPSGRWRTNYANRNKKKRLRVDSSFEMADGKPFRNISEFKKLVLQDKEQLARNVVDKLMTYGTGETVQFADRKVIDDCVRKSAEKDFGFKTILKSVVTSKTFLNK